MLPMDEAVERLLAQVVSLERTESVTTALARGRVLARDLISPLDVPPYDNSAMDGYAMRAADVAAAGGEGAVLPLSQRIAAGSVPTALLPGTAARIFTGATVPEGADSVLMQEMCEALPDAAGGLGQVRLNAPLVEGLHIRRRGEDLRVGQLVLPGQPLGPGQIYNSNRTTLHALLLAMGCEVRDLGIVPDSLEATRAALREAAKDADLILSSGGVSVGEEDHLKPALEREGRLDLWQIAIKPGKPLAFGEVTSVGGRTWYMGLPGNPVSTS
ncbi:putative molybdopterin binding domain-containing protein [Ditylenchus destructor]|nr:putative molybdopterin binding domain-containing protein [Ditylenchus destructor]